MPKYLMNWEENAIMLYGGYIEADTPEDAVHMLINSSKRIKGAKSKAIIKPTYMQFYPLVESIQVYDADTEELIIDSGTERDDQKRIIKSLRFTELDICRQLNEELRKHDQLLADKYAPLQEIAEGRLKQIHALEEAISKRNDRIRELLKLTGETKRDLLDRINDLRLENGKMSIDWHDQMRKIVELEEMPIVWHKYPEEKPTEMKRYLVYGEQVVEDTEISVRYWGGDQFYEDEADITHWAEVKNIPGGGPYNG
jgi:hypothetical protein